MARPPIPAKYVELLKKPLPAVLATVRPDGAPVSVATWYLWEDDRILFNMDGGRKRLDHLRADPRVSLTVLDENWYRHISVQGTVKLEPDPDLVDIDRIAAHYGAGRYGNRERERVSAWLEIESYHVWGF